MDQMDFGSFLERNQKYKQVFDGLSKPFNRFFVTALDYCHQIDLHLNQGPSKLLDEKKQQLFSCMEDILSRIEEPYAAEVQAAFDAFKQQHGNDKPIVHAPLKFQQLLESFLEFVEKQINPRPPQEQQVRLPFDKFLQERVLGLLGAIEQRLTNENKGQLSLVRTILERDGLLQRTRFLGGAQHQSLNLTNTGLEEIGVNPECIKNPVTFGYIDALRGAYAMFLASTQEALEDIPEKSRDSIKQSLELKNCLALSWTIQTQSQNQ